MKTYIKYICIIITLSLFNCTSSTNKVISYSTESLQVTINEKGLITKMIDRSSTKNYSVVSKSSPLVSLKIKDSIFLPKTAIFSKETGFVSLLYDNSFSVDVKMIQKKNHITFEVVAVSNQENIDALVWGPYHSTINKSIGETIGIVQNDDFTIGLQALNIKTLGGYPWNDNDHLPQLDIFGQSDYENMVNEKGNIFTLYSVEAAKPTSSGSSLQAYTRNRTKDRIVKNVNHDRFTSPAHNNGGLIGSKIALFGSKTDKALATIGKIELEEGLPHPMINGEWVKTSSIMNSSYMILDFTEKNIDKCISYTKKAGFNYLYHSHPFASWGHFPLIKSQFPNGYYGMKTCVEKAEREGIYLGTHMLTNFINVTDKYITPVPDKRLAIVGSSVLVKGINATQTTIEIKNPDFFNQFKNNHLRSVKIGNEIIRYGSVSRQAPWFLENCQRGAFNTKATSYKKGVKIDKLADHGYKVFLGNTELNKEIAENMADFMNATGVRMLDFDGLEGAGDANATGNYGEALFADAWHNRLNDNLKNHFVLGASRPGHYFWHTYSRMNWGEPWYAGFRESQTAYRLRNQAYFKRNLMPGMLGWFRMTSSTTIEDIEWLMTRSAAYNAGFAFSTNFKAIEGNGHTEEIFSLMNVWETARLQGVFTKEVQKRMQDLDTEFRLKRKDENNLVLTQMYSHKFEHLKKVRQPGEPLYSTFTFENKNQEQVLNFIITAKKSDISEIVMEVNNYKKVALKVSLKKGQVIKYNGSDTAIIYDNTWHKIKEISIDISSFILQQGSHSITFDCNFNNTKEEAKAKIELRLKGEEEIITIK